MKTLKLSGEIHPLYVLAAITLLMIVLLAANVYSGIHVYSKYQTLQSLSQSSNDSTDLHTQIRQINAQNERLETWLESQSQSFNFDSFPEFVLSTAKKSGIKSISKLSTMSNEDDKDVTERYRIALSGPYSGVMRFINKLETSGTPVRITQLDMESNAESTISCDMRVSILKTNESMKALDL